MPGEKPAPSTPRSLAAGRKIASVKFRVPVQLSPGTSPRPVITPGHQEDYGITIEVDRELRMLWIHNRMRDGLNELGSTPLENCNISYEAWREP